MSSYTTSEIRSGMKVILDGDPYAIVDNEFVKPGKGQAFNRIKVRNLKNGRTIERTFRSGESLEEADVTDAEIEVPVRRPFVHCMIPASVTSAASSDSPERKVRSIVRPFFRLRTLMRLKACPLPGFTNSLSTIAYGSPSRMTFIPERISLVV